MRTGYPSKIRNADFRIDRPIQNRKRAYKKACLHFTSYPDDFPAPDMSLYTMRSRASDIQSPPSESYHMSLALVPVFLKQSCRRMKLGRSPHLI